MVVNLFLETQTFMLERIQLAHFYQDEFAGDGVDLYDDVIATAPGNPAEDGPNDGPPHINPSGPPPSGPEETNGAPPYHQHGNNITPNTIGRRHQLYVGNLTWVSLL